MTRSTDRRSLLAGAGGAILMAATATRPALAGGIRGTVEFEGGAAIPEGRLVVTLEDRNPTKDAQAGKAAQARVDMDSDGAATALEFDLPATGASAPQKGEIVVRLERADGWLLARGSSPLKQGEPVRITLFTAMY